MYGADVYTSKAWLKHYMGYFADNDADIVVGVTPRTGYLATYEGTDVVIVTTDNEGVSTQGVFLGFHLRGTFSRKRAMWASSS